MNFQSEIDLKHEACKHKHLLLFGSVKFHVLLIKFILKIRNHSNLFSLMQYIIILITNLKKKFNEL